MTREDIRNLLDNVEKGDVVSIIDVYGERHGDNITDIDYETGDKETPTYLYLRHDLMKAINYDRLCVMNLNGGPKRNIGKIINETKDETAKLSEDYLYDGAVTNIR